ncbi:SGNH/GDSL hydrolase family protein [Flavobacterium sp.]|uniref:SGNH/GDSL hydrolase family protein n=1 Tax=Flavobacterium sp. TaxID=239 RepID=UPI003752256F
MKKNLFKIVFASFLLLLASSCSVGNPDEQVNPKSLSSGTILIPIPNTPSQTPVKEINYLALGDSYTIGQSVCETCRFPEQLKKSLGNVTSLKIIAQTGWTTTNLISAINAQNPTTNYDLVTLLIGVNNQYQNLNFQVYQYEFPELINKAIALAKGDKTNVIVVSIPDYAYTPFGQQSVNPAKISTEIDKYNAYAQKYCLDNNIEYINITDITRQGLLNPKLVATDGLHPSELAYSYFIERILPKAIFATQN